MYGLRKLWLSRMIAVCALWALAGPVWAQPGGDPFGGSGAGFGFGSRESVVSVKAEFTRPEGGQPARLFVTATMKSGWHVYSITQPVADLGPKPTKIQVADSPDYRLLGSFQANVAPTKEKQKVFNDLVVESHGGQVVWHAPLEFSPGVDPAALKIKGTVKVQACSESSCLPPQTYPFVASVGQGIAVPRQVAPSAAQMSTPSVQPRSEARDPRAPAELAPDKANGQGHLPWRPFTLAAFRQLVGPQFDSEVMREHLARGRSQSSMFREVIWGFLGGLLLNLMPCVLPVIGLKVLSFVEQSGHSRRRAFALNFWYSLGLMSIFLVLATLAVSLNLGWGHLFKYPAFNVTMAVVVFVMGLSFLGVWEIPIPGFVGRGKASDLAEAEGLSGAFAKGAITTILATPCTGPFMGTALAWAVSQPPLKTYAVFASVGLGMASPYLLIGVFPRLIGFLPRPGAWMETFKQVMGFVLLGTVVYILTFLEWSYVVPTVGLLFASWAACWWVNRTPPTAELGEKARAWLDAAALVGVAWVLMFLGTEVFLSGKLAFSGVQQIMASRFQSRVERDWATQLEQDGLRVVQGTSLDSPTIGPRTVLVDFTADWCATCKTLEAAVLNTPEVREAVARNGVVTMQADWTHEAPEVTQFLDWLGFRQVPVVAIFPAGDPNRPVLFVGWYQQKDILEAVSKTGLPQSASRMGPEQQNR